MRALRINKDRTVDEVQRTNSEWVGAEESWEIVPLDGTHDIYVDDSALLGMDAVVVGIGGKDNIPLPAYVTGVEGESTVAATMTVDALLQLIT